jgi:RNA polymerase sigma-70 factor, ECF subfamily
LCTFVFFIAGFIFTSAFAAPSCSKFSLTMDEERLRRLFARIAGGDEAAEQELVGELRPRMRAVAFLRGVRGSDLDDVLQNGLSAVVVQLRDGRFKDFSSPSTWVIRILLNKVADCFRAHGRSAAISSAAADRLPSLNTRSRADQHVRVEVMQALARLTPTERFVLTSTELIGLTYQEVAARLKCPPGTVASTKNRAISKLREFFRGPHRPELQGGPDGDV